MMMDILDSDQKELREELNLFLEEMIAEDAELYRLMKKPEKPKTMTPKIESTTTTALATNTCVTSSKTPYCKFHPNSPYLCEIYKCHDKNSFNQSKCFPNQKSNYNFRNEYDSDDDTYSNRFYKGPESNFPSYIY